MLHNWPGNVRELRNVLERMVIVAREGLLQLEHTRPRLWAYRRMAFAAWMPNLPTQDSGSEAEQSFTT